LPAIRTMIIHLGYRLPDTSSDRPGGSCGPHSVTSLFGLAPGGVYLASPVTRRTGALLPHRFTLTPLQAGRFAFCCTCLRVTATPRYGAPCPVVFGLSSRPLKARRSSGLLRPPPCCKNRRTSSPDSAPATPKAWWPRDCLRLQWIATDALRLLPRRRRAL
jgi:hypothetical protein